MKVVVCDDHPIFRAAILRVLEGALEDCQTVEVSSARELRSYCLEHDGLDLLFLDLELQDAHGLALIPEFLSHFSTGIAILSASESQPEIQAALTAGACGFIPKSTSLPIMRQAIQLILLGGTYIPTQALATASRANTHIAYSKTNESRGDKLTERQKEILVLASRGLTNKEIGRLLTISENTIKAHLRSIYKELDVTNRTEATMVWMQLSG